MTNQDTRLFFVVYSDEDNEEIFETLEEADNFSQSIMNPHIAICIVKNAFREHDNSWNYEDSSNTFELIKKLQ